MTGTHRTGRSPAPVAAQDGPAAVVIAERSPRWVAMITTIILAVLPGLEVTQHSPAVLSRGHVPVALAYLAAAAAVSIWGCWRGWRMGLRLDDHGVTVRNFFHSHQFGWHEVSRFADGSVHGGEAGRLWALSVVLRDGHVITASGTSWGKRDARPQTLTAIRQAAGRHAIPAPLTGTAMRPESPGSPANPGRYPDPGGQLGSRYWSGREWSPFLRPDPASGGPEGATASAEVWSPLPGSEQQWHDAAARTRRARIAFTVWLAATAAAAAVMVALYARDLSKPHADFTSAVWALIATGSDCSRPTAPGRSAGISGGSIGRLRRRPGRPAVRAAPSASALTCHPEWKDRLMSSDYPAVLYSARPVARRRVTVVFRAVLVIPQLVVLYFVSLAALAVLVIGWFAVLLAGRWPRGLQSFVVGWMRWTFRVRGYWSLIVDDYPPFSFQE